MNSAKIYLTKRNDETYSEYNLRDDNYNAMCSHKQSVVVSTYCLGSVLHKCQQLRRKLQVLNRRLLKVKHQNKLLRQEIERLRLREWESFTCK